MHQSISARAREGNKICNRSHNRPFNMDKAVRMCNDAGFHVNRSDNEWKQTARAHNPRAGRRINPGSSSVRSVSRKHIIAEISF